MAEEKRKLILLSKIINSRSEKVDLDHLRFLLSQFIYSEKKRIKQGKWVPEGFILRVDNIDQIYQPLIEELVTEFGALLEDYPLEETWILFEIKENKRSKNQAVNEFIEMINEQVEGKLKIKLVLQKNRWYTTEDGHRRLGDSDATRLNRLKTMLDGWKLSPEKQKEYIRFALDAWSNSKVKSTGNLVGFIISTKILDDFLHDKKLNKSNLAGFTEGYQDERKDQWDRINGD